MTFSPADLQNSFGNYSFRISSSTTVHNGNQSAVPHQGSLCRVEGQGEITYILEILLENKSTHELIFHRKDFDFSLRLFSIMDTESCSYITKATVEEFMALRCPVFWRRDEDLRGRAIESDRGISPTFEEVWSSVTSCSIATRNMNSDEISFEMISIEGWMVFCRFIALAQYLEAKRRFSGRHLQQPEPKNEPRGDDLVVVDVPPVAPPVRLTANEIARYERENQKCLPLPELDLDHSLLAAHDVLRRRRRQKGASLGSIIGDRVKIDLFGPSPLLLSSNSSTNRLEFCLTLIRNCGDNDSVSQNAATVRRSINDIKWLHDTFVSHKVLGGTLCGRILPPFPGNQAFSKVQEDKSSFVTTGAIAAATNAGKEFAHAGVGIAAAGVGILKEGIKSLWGSYGSTASSLSKHQKEKSSANNSSTMRKTMKTYYNPNSPVGKARHLERYLNYLLEHPALSTSFPLNTILKASQSGLEAAKQSLEEHARASKEINEQAPTIDDGKMSTFWSLQGPGSSVQPNLTWVRTAAQAAVALQLHGVLETTGLPSASARLQHASLPNFNNSRNSDWTVDDEENVMKSDSDESPENVVEDSFEEGVLHVEDGLASDYVVDQDDGEGYDLLPLPVPAPERQILNVSESKKYAGTTKEARRFRYDDPSLPDGLAIDSTEDDNRVYIGEMAIDENIDQLREVIGSVDNILSRCMASSCGIERSRRERFALNLDILRGLDSWEGLRGKFVTQRALLKGLPGLEQSREVFEESDLTLIDDISWQTALAHSAVSAAEDVRSTVRAARTASNAKFAAVSAAQIAKSVCEKGEFGNINEARAAQTRSSIAQSHAIHATVVEHEAKTVKRRATLALAHDVKRWNVHRKREVLKICLEYAKSQHEGTRRAVDAWSCLRDGFVGSTIIPSTQYWKSTTQEPVQLNDESEVRALIFGNVDQADGERQPIVAVDHSNLKVSTGNDDSNSSSINVEPGDLVSMVFATPIPEEFEATSCDGERDIPLLGSTLFESEEVVSGTDQEQTEDDYNAQSEVTKQSLTSFDRASMEGSTFERENDEAALTSSMQSLVDGLINWGGIDVEDNFALPTGMAASIAMEESVAFGNSP